MKKPNTTFFPSLPISPQFPSVFHISQTIGDVFDPKLLRPPIRNVLTLSQWNFGTRLRAGRSTPPISGHYQISLAQTFPPHLHPRKRQSLMPASIGRRLGRPMCSKLTVPGLRKDELKVEVEDDRILQISGETKREFEDRGDTWHRVERSGGKFMRRLRLPETASADQVKASMENGF